MDVEEENRPIGKTKEELVEIAGIAKARRDAEIAEELASRTRKGREVMERMEVEDSPDTPEEKTRRAGGNYWWDAMSDETNYDEKEGTPTTATHKGGN